MDTRTQETKIVSEEAKSTDSTNTVKLVEMGDVSVETKGILRYLELGYTPRNY